MFCHRTMVVGVASLVLTLVPCSAFAQSIFWANEWHGIYRANADGSDALHLYATDDTKSTAQGIAIANDGTIYWTDYRTKTIRRTNSDGSGTTARVSCDGEPRGIAVDDASGKMYWAQSGGGYPAVKRSNLDGSDLQVLVVSHYKPGEMLNAIGIAVDALNNKLFWTDPGGNQIWQAGLGGTNAKPVLTGLSGPFMLTLDTRHKKLYFSSPTTGTILSANYDGSGLRTVITTGLVEPRGIALDLDGGKMYTVFGDNYSFP
jgi:DNA-binding beta-propeller fold protein YncE